MPSLSTPIGGMGGPAPGCLGLAAAPLQASPSSLLQLSSLARPHGSGVSGSGDRTPLAEAPLSADVALLGVLHASDPSATPPTIDTAQWHRNEHK